MEHIAAVVGSTLAPGGSAVLIERQDFGLPPLVTKDGMTVFQYLGYDDPTPHAIMESARDMAALFDKLDGLSRPIATTVGRSPARPRKPLPALL